MERGASPRRPGEAPGPPRRVSLHREALRSQGVLKLLHGQRRSRANELQKRVGRFGFRRRAGRRIGHRMLAIVPRFVPAVFPVFFPSHKNSWPESGFWRTRAGLEACPTSRPPVGDWFMATATRPGFHVMAKPTGAACNLDCAYCFFLSKQSFYPGSNFRMSDEVMESYVRQTIEAHSGPEVTITWQGGEPTLMGLDFYRRAVEAANRYRKPGTTVQHTIQTNGILLDAAWCEFHWSGS